MTEEKKVAVQRELKAKMGCGDVQEGDPNYYDFMDRIVDAQESDEDKKIRIKDELRAKQGCGDVEEAIHNPVVYLRVFHAVPREAGGLADG